MKRERTLYRLICVFLLIAAAAFGIWYFMIYSNRHDFTKNSTLVKDIRDIGCVLGDTGKNMGQCIQKGLKSL